MKRCLACGSIFDSLLITCSVCGDEPVIVDGFSAFAPDFPRDESGFKSSYFSELADLEATNFWFKSRNRLISWALDKYRPNFNSLLEIGCGTGFVLSGLAQTFPQVRLVGSEIFTEGLEYAAKRVPSAKFLQMDARLIPFYEEFEVIGAFDVLEHIEEDETVLKQINLAMKPGGMMLITVPQHDWLWSANDDYACHVRRYKASDLHQKVEATGFKIERSTSFISALLPAMMLSRLFKGQKSSEEYNATSEFNIPGWLNNLFIMVLRVEQYMIDKGINFPVGGSRLVIARKQ